MNSTQLWHCVVDVSDLARRRAQKIEPRLAHWAARQLLVLFFVASLLPQSTQAQLAGEPAANDEPAPILSRDREASLIFYRTHYQLSGLVEGVWNGDADSCDPGITEPAFREAVLKRINYYRGMAGLPPALLDESYNQKAQQAALITTINGLNHRPPPSSRCYTADGALAAANAHLYIGRYGPAAIDGYIQDHDEGFHENYHVGHRRWILLPQLRRFGTGDIAGGEGIAPANALWVVDSSMREPRPATRDGFVAWPPPGYVPYTVVYPRWSFSYPEADFSEAVVHMTLEGKEIEVMVEPLYVWEPTEATLVWIPLGLGSRDPWPRPQQDTTYTVNITNISVGGHWLAFSYEVTVFDPMAPFVQATPTVPAMPTPRLLHYRQSLLQ